MSQDAFVPEITKIPVEPLMTPQVEFKNLADDEDLVKHVLDHIQYTFNKYRSNRSELDDIWDAADYMLKCAQSETQREVERGRNDRDSSDNTTKTKSQKVGSTLFHRQIRTLAALLIDILKSRRDPFLFQSRSNPDVPYSGFQVHEQAEQYNALMRFTREADKFDEKAIELAWELLTYGNVPIFVGWREKRAEILDRQQQPDGSTSVVRKEVLTEFRPSMSWINNRQFYADQNVPMRNQTSFGITSAASWSDMYDMQRNGEYLNVENLTASHLYQGGANEARDTEDVNSGYGASTNDTQTGMFRQFDWYAMLPIDEDRGAGKRWDDKKNPLKRYWITIATALDPQQGVCLRIQRNDDPDDEWPVEMLSVMPVGKGLYKLSIAQVARGNFNECTTTKQQILDRRTLRNNRPLKRKSSVRAFISGAPTEDMTFRPDLQMVCDDPDADVKEFQIDSTPENFDVLRYLDNDTDEAVGTNRITRGEPMGGRTSSNEVEKAYGAAARPHMMMLKYIINKWLRFYGRKCIRRWTIHAPDDLILKITDSKRLLDVSPAALRGDFDIRIDLVDEYENNIMQAQKFVFAAQNILPMFQDVLELRELAKDAFDKVLQWDVTRYIKPDTGQATIVYAKKMIEAMKQGQELPIPDSMDLAVLERELKGVRVLWMGVENTEQGAWVMLLDRAIAQVELKKQQQPMLRPMGAAPSGNQTEGEVAGNMIAAQKGAEAQMQGGA